jgi:lipoprotein NlpI
METQQSQWLYPPMARSLQPTIQQEVKIVRLSQLLQRDDLTHEIQAKIFYERGNCYDSLGLKNLARLDFEQSLRLVPAQPDVFNVLGVYFTEIGEYDSAYEAFDSTLELAPDNNYARRNQAIALYYGNRPNLALEEINQAYKGEPGDPFFALWRYFIAGELDPVTARKNLQLIYRQQDHQQWGWALVGMILEDVPEKDLFQQVVKSAGENNKLLAQRLTEAYFYLGKRYQMQGKYAQATTLFKLSIALNVYEYVEHRYAFIELGRIHAAIEKQQPKDADI